MLTEGAPDSEKLYRAMKGRKNRRREMEGGRKSPTRFRRADVGDRHRGWEVRSCFKDAAGEIRRESCVSVVSFLSSIYARRLVVYNDDVLCRPLSSLVHERPPLVELCYAEAAVSEGILRGIGFLSLPNSRRLNARLSAPSHANRRRR